MSLRAFTAAVVAALVALGAPAGAMAADQTANAFDDHPPDGCDPVSPGEDCTLREAVIAVNQYDAVTVPAGYYTLTEGPLPIDVDMEIRGAGARTTTIDAGGTSRVGNVDGMFAVNAVIRGVTIMGGNADVGTLLDPGQGGAFRVVADGELWLEQSAVVGNTAAANGGGISSLGEIHLEQSLIAGNTVEGAGGTRSGGGIHVASGGRLTVSNSTVSENTVINHDGPALGGGIYSVDQLDLEHATIANNGASNGGGGLYQAGSGVFDRLMANTLVAGNTGGACGGNASILETDHSLADDGSCLLNGPGDLQVADAGIAALDDYGGPTDTHALYPGSPAIDGSNNCGDLDQRGVPRSSPPCDIGAYEGSVAGSVGHLDSNPFDLYADGLGALQFRFDGSEDGVFYPPSSDAAHAGLEIVEGSNYYSLGDDERLSVSGPTVGPTTITSTYTVGSNLAVTEQIAHAAGSPFVDLHYVITNTSDLPVSFRAGELSDLYVAGSDSGSGAFELGPPRFVGGRGETGVTSGLVEMTPSWTHFQAGDFDLVFGNFATSHLDNTVDPAFTDNGVGAEWAFDAVEAHDTRTIDVRWRLESGGTVTPPPPPPPDPPLPSQELPPPVAGKSVNAETKSGTVKIKLPGSNKFVVLGEQQLPRRHDRRRDEGPRDARRRREQDRRDGDGRLLRGDLQGRADEGLEADHDADSSWRSSAVRSAGRRARRRKRRRSAICGATARASSGPPAPTARRPCAVRIGWWRTRCTSTLTKVKRGSVTVRDFVKKKNVIVKAGKKYVAKRKR